MLSFSITKRNQGVMSDLNFLLEDDLNPSTWAPPPLSKRRVDQFEMGDRVRIIGYRPGSLQAVAQEGRITDLSEKGLEGGYGYVYVTLDVASLPGLESVERSYWAKDVSKIDEFGNIMKMIGDK